MQATGDLIIIAFYYLLRCSEYTTPRYGQWRNGNLKRSTHKKRFAVGDVGFWKVGCQLTLNSPLHLLLQAESATLKTTNHNNVCMLQTKNHEYFASDLCPYKALARRIHHILTNGDSTELYICKYREKIKDFFATVTLTDIITAILLSVSALKLRHAGIDPDLVYVHSLRSGRGMYLKLHGTSNTTIINMGRWYSLTFLMCIDNQIGHISTILAQTMSRPIPFLNNPAIET